VQTGDFPHAYYAFYLHAIDAPRLLLDASVE